MFVFMVTGQREERARTARRRLIIVGRMAQPRRKRPRVCRGEAKLRKDDVLLVQAYELPLVPKSLIAATVVSGRQERQTFLDKTAGALAVPPTMRIDQLIEIDSVESLLPRLSERAELTVLGKIHQHSAGRGHSGIPPAQSRCTSCVKGLTAQRCRNGARGASVASPLSPQPTAGPTADQHHWAGRSTHQLLGNGTEANTPGLLTVMRAQHEQSCPIQ